MNHDKINETIAKNLKRIRLENHQTQKSIAGMLGITFQQVQKYERAQDRLPVSAMFIICSQLNVEPNDFMDDYND